MGILYSCCCGGEREGIAAEPLLRDPEVYTPSNVPIEQYNNPGNIASSHLGSNERPEINGSFRQIDFPQGVGRQGLVNGQITGYSTSLVEQRLNEEATALQDVLNDMANNVFDLNMLAALAHAQPGHGGYQTHGNVPHLHPTLIEPPYVQERAQEYGKRLQRNGHAIAEKARLTLAPPEIAPNIPGGLADLGSHAEVENAIFSETISDNDAMLIAEVSARAQEAFKEFKIEHCESLIVQFGQQPINQYNQSYTPAQQSLSATGMA